MTTATAEREGMKRRILAIGLTVEEFWRVVPLLDRDRFEIDRAPGAQAALEIATRQRVDVLLVRYPLPDMVLPPFLRVLRNPRSPCRQAPLLLLADAERCREARRYIGRGANRALALGSSLGALSAIIDNLLHVAPRKPCRVIAQLRFKSDELEDWILCRSENGSRSGILLATDRRLPPGTRVDFELTLPTVERPVVGEAEIARLTLSGRDRVRGMGLRFLSFAEGTQKVYEEYLNGT